MEWKHIVIRGELQPLPVSGHSITTLSDNSSVFIFGGIHNNSKRTNQDYIFDTSEFF